MNDSNGRYRRHTLIDWFSQDEVSGARIAVVGAGAIGNEVVKNLALLGVGEVDVFDFDRVELHNLTRSILLRESDVGRSKAQALVERAREIDPNCRLRAIDGDVRDLLNPSALAGYRAVVGAVDNFEARLRLNQLCFLAGVDFVNAAIDSRYVSVETFAHSRWNVACYECHLPESAYARLAERYSCGGLRRRAFEERKVPTTAITASLAGAMSAASALNLGGLAGGGRGGSGQIVSRRVFMDTHRMSSQTGALERQSGCGCCQGHARRPSREDATERLAALQAEAARGGRPEATLVLSDAIIVGAACRLCGNNALQSADDGSMLLGRRGRTFDDRLSWCARCQAASVDIELRDRMTPDDLAACLSRAEPSVQHAPVPFALLYTADDCSIVEWPVSF